MIASIVESACMSHVSVCAGVWLGLVAGYTVITLLAGGSVLQSDWRQLAEDAQSAASSSTSVAETSTSREIATAQ